MKKSTVILIIIVLLGASYFVFQTLIQKHFLLKDTIPWSPNVQIDFKDYQGVPDFSTDNQLYSWHGFYLTWQGCQTGTYDFEVTAFFDKEKSWVKDETTDEARNKIRFHQLRFDVYEVFAQKFRNEVESIEDPCEYDQARINLIGDKYFKQAEYLWTQILDSEYPSFEEKLTSWKEVVDIMMEEAKNKKTAAHN